MPFTGTFSLRSLWGLLSVYYLVSFIFFQRSSSRFPESLNCFLDLLLGVVGAKVNLKATEAEVK